MNKYHQCWQKKKADKKNPLFKENVSDCKSVNIDGIYLFYKFLWVKTDSEQKSIHVIFHENW